MTREGAPLPRTALLLCSHLQHSCLGDNQQDVRATIGLLQGHQLIHGPWLSELERGALPTHPALAVHIAKLVELGSRFGQVAGLELDAGMDWRTISNTFRHQRPHKCVVIPDRGSLHLSEPTVGEGYGDAPPRSGWCKGLRD